MTTVATMLYAHCKIFISQNIPLPSMHKKPTKSVISSRSVLTRDATYPWMDTLGVTMDSLTSWVLRTSPLTCCQFETRILTPRWMSWGLDRKRITIYQHVNWSLYHYYNMTAITGSAGIRISISIVASYTIDRPFTATYVSISPYPYRKPRYFYFHLANCRSYHPRPPLDATAPRLCSSSSMIVGSIVSCWGQWGAVGHC